MTPNEPDFVGLSSNPTASPSQSGPYYWWLNGRGNLNWGLPLAVGTVIEFTYSFWPLSLNYLFAGTASSAGVTVTGTGTNFTQLLQPDFQVAGTPTSGHPVLAAGSSYVLAALPEIPREHIRVIAAFAVRNMYSVAGDDSRVQEWSAIATGNMAMMKDSLIERQSNNPPTKQRFPYGVGRRNRAFMR